ncbi:HemK2/MTQ2 family protein methyltransferase [Mycobacterium sp. NPDC006124]|uniref:HemK2/MTQ2 family protein methyltransferase n=1 Tax=Mycobacterium sp. NPDC006124 TaxID=3156729 RepID=UPI0033A918E1
MTTIFTDELIDRSGPIRVPTGVYPPQEDSALLIGALRVSGRAAGNRVADLCSGSGVVALAAAEQGAATVAAFEMSSVAVDCARSNAATAGLAVKVHRGSWTRAVEFEPFDVVTCNPPYVPFDDGADDAPVSESAGPATAWNAGRDGRRILDPLCERAPELLADGGSIFVVHSEFAHVDRTVDGLTAAGLRASVVAEQWIPFGPVLTARAHWLERIGMLEVGRRVERLAVVRADRV